MRIRELQVEGFGVWHDLNLKLGPTLCVLEGPNEAGKSTLMNFIRSIWFGFERRGQAGRGEPLRGGRHGGRLVIEDENGTLYTIERLARDPGPSAGTVVVYDDLGNQLDESFLTRLLGGVGRELFYSVFAFGLGELEQLETLQKDEVSASIYSAGLDTPVPIAQVDQQLSRAGDALFRPGAAKPLINRLLSRLDSTYSEIALLKQQPQQYAAIKEERDRLLQTLDQLQRELESVQEQMVWYKTLASIHSPWEELVQIQQSLSELPQIDEFPALGVQRLNQQTQRVRELEAALKKCEEAVRDVEYRLSQQPDGPVLVQMQHELDELRESRSAYERLLEESKSLKADLMQRSREVQGALESAGGTWDEKAVEGFDTGLLVREAVRSFGRDLQEYGEQVQQAKFALEFAERQRDQCEGDYRDIQDQILALNEQLPRVGHDYESRCQARDTYQSLKFELQMLEKDKRRLEEAILQLEEEIQQLSGGQNSDKESKSVNRWLVYTGVTLAGLSVLLYLTGVFVWAAVCAAAGITMVLLYPVSAVSYRNAISALRQMTQRELAHLKAKVEEYRSDYTRTLLTIDEKQQKLQDAATVFAGVSNPSDDEIDTALKRLEAERDIRTRLIALKEAQQDCRTRWEAAVSRAAAAKQKFEDAKEAYDSALSRWKSWLQTRGMPPEISVDGAIEVIQAVHAAKDALRARRAAQAQLVQNEQEIAEYLNRLNRIMQKCGRRPVDADEAVFAVSWLNEDLEKYVGLSKELKDRQKALAEAQRELSEAKSELNLLLEEAGAEDTEEFLFRSQVYEKRQNLFQRALQLRVEIQARCGAWDLENVYRALEKTPPQSFQQKVAELAAKEQQLVQKIAESQTRLGELKQQLSDLENDERLTALQFTADTLMEELNRKAWEWARLVIAQELIHLAREKYEKERQPAVLRLAGEYLNAMTCGHYLRVYSPLGQKEIRVETADRRQLTVDQLSRGTLEQLYLAMRLALAHEFARRAAPLPLVMDDILVNFDPVRLVRTASVLRQISEKHQILFFTCHPHVAAALKGSEEETIIRLGDVS